MSYPNFPIDKLDQHEAEKDAANQPPAPSPAPPEADSPLAGHLLDIPGVCGVSTKAVYVAVPLTEELRQKIYALWPDAPIVETGEFTALGRASVSEPSGENALIAERDREWGLALAEIDVAALATSIRHGRIIVEHATEPPTAPAPLDAREWRKQNAAGGRLEEDGQFYYRETLVDELLTRYAAHLRQQDAARLKTAAKALRGVLEAWRRTLANKPVRNADELISKAESALAEIEESQEQNAKRQSQKQ